MGQENAPPGLLRGDLISSQGAPKQGQFKFLVWPDHVYVCSYDERTYVERDSQAISMDRLDKGEHLEVVADRQSGTGVCYARAVQSITPARGRARSRSSDAVAVDSWSQPFTVTGAVVSISPEMLILRQRSGEHKVIQLRAETRYLHDGQATDRTALQNSTVVFIRAIENVRGNTEASQVIWGDILSPHP